jgi:hypothetical protein
VLKATGLANGGLIGVHMFWYTDASGDRHIVDLAKTTLVKKSWRGNFFRLESGEELLVPARLLAAARGVDRRWEQGRRDAAKAEVLADYRASHTGGERFADGLLNAGHIDREVKRRAKDRNQRGY